MNLKTQNNFNITYCPQCANKLEDQSHEAGGRLICSNPGCGYAHYDNPVPVVAIIVETTDGVVIAHNRQWPAGMYSIISGFLEHGESPEDCAKNAKTWRSRVWSLASLF